ncbi:MAG: hypothetical protein ACI9U2_001123 [Bradymonadia bacterium]|jgi:hypothetical protein
MIATLTAILALMSPLAASPDVAECAVAVRDVAVGPVAAARSSAQRCAAFARTFGCDPAGASEGTQCIQPVGLPVHIARTELMVRWLATVDRAKEVTASLASGQFVDDSGALRIESIRVAVHMGVLTHIEAGLLANLFAIAAFVVPDPPAWRSQ